MNDKCQKIQIDTAKSVQSLLPICFERYTNHREIIAYLHVYTFIKANSQSSILQIHTLCKYQEKKTFRIKKIA